MPPTSPPDDDATRVYTRPREAARDGETLPGDLGTAAEGARMAGRYVIGPCLGRGGMATVYRAHDPGIGRDVALKFLHASLCQDADVRGRFLREARAAGALSHPSIVTVHDVGEIDGRPYMAMELIEGQPLSEAMQPGQPMAVARVLAIGIQLARALDYAHAHGVVHRDIKPGNLIRLQDSDTVKVTDFGIAHMDSGGTQQHTRVGDILGTPQYMSPEQAQGARLDGRSDLFSAGIVLYQLLAGQPPFQADTLVALALKITRDDPAPLQQVRPGLPPALRRVVERCLAKAPERRFQSGHDLAEALVRVQAGLNEALRTRDAPRIVPLRLQWAGLTALVVAVVMALAGTAITRLQSAAMLRQAADSGAASARFLAAQNATSVLEEDWAAVEVALHEVMATGDFHSVVVVDREGTVRAASTAALVGQPYQAPPGAMAIGDAVPGLRYAVDGAAVLGFEAPVTFQGKRVGQVALGLLEAPLLQVARLSMWLMLALALVVVASVALAVFMVARQFNQPVRLLREGMDEIARGHFDHRIDAQRHDEFGLLYAAFDDMARALLQRQIGTGPAPVTPTPAPDHAPPRAA